MITCNDVHATKDGEHILRGVTFELNKGERVLLMGPNGSGKTSFAHVLMGDPSYEAKSGTVTLKTNSGTEDMLSLSVHERARKGIFLGFQHPLSVPGVSAYELLYTAYREVHPEDTEGDDIAVFEERIRDAAETVGIEAEFLSRGVNEGFSGGERKKLELVQMLVLDPAYVMLDEPDSGLDADSVKAVKSAVESLPEDTAVLIISHDPTRLKMTDFDRVLIMSEGQVAESGGAELIERVSRDGYE